MKRKININRPEISADEINQRKNFDETLNQFSKISTKPFYKKPWFSSGIFAVAVVITTGIILYNKKSDTTKESIAINTEQTLSPTDSIALAEFYAKEEAKPCINPPLNGINIAYTTYKVNAQKGAILTHETGSVLTIPKNAFTDANGKILKGEIEIKYREFHDPVDFLISGIPMTYDSAGTKYHFESAGMMEILAYQNGKQVSIAPDKSIDVELASEDDSDKFNLYKLDTFKNNWACIGKDKVVKKTEKPSITMNTQADSISSAKPPELVKLEKKKVEVKKEKEEQIAALPKAPVEPKKPEQAKKDSYTFDLDVNEKEFPELALYKGTLFEIGKDDKTFNSGLYKITWDDAKLKANSKKGDSYLLSLKKGSKQYEFVVYPVFEGKNYETALNDFQKKFKEYNIALDKRTKEEKRIEEEYNARLAKLKKEQEELEAEWKRKEEEHFKTFDSQQKIFRTFAVNGFGVYNCDSPNRYPQGVITSAELLNATKVKLMCYNVYLVDKKLNGMYTYYKNPLTRFTYNPASENILWTVENGVLYYLKPDDFKNFSAKNGMKEVTMKQLPTDFKTPEEIKTFFGI